MPLTPKPTKCDECEGTGKRYSHVYGGYINRECWFCKGTGIVPVEIVPVEDSDQKITPLAMRDTR